MRVSEISGSKVILHRACPMLACKRFDVRMSRPGTALDQNPARSPAAMQKRYYPHHIKGIADISANYVGQRIIAELRKSLAARILAAPIDQLEIYRTHRLIPVLTQDVDTISDFAFFFSSFFVSLVIALGCMVYLAVLSWPLF